MKTYPEVTARPSTASEQATFGESSWTIEQAGRVLAVCCGQLHALALAHALNLWFQRKEVTE